MIWDDAKITAFDLETSGEITHTDLDTGKPTSAYALQPWRLKQGKGWITSGSMLRHDGANGMVKHLSQLFPTRDQLKSMLEDVVANGWTILGWNIAFDIAWLMALGPDIEDLCLRIRWLDGMLLWRHLEIEPEYEFQSARHKKKRYRLKPEAMERWLPGVPLHNDDIDFHSTDPDSLARLQEYNDRDNLYTWVISKMIWERLTDKQRKAALIEAEALPMVAQANLHGLPVDRLAVKHLAAKLDMDAADRLAELAPDGMREDIVRSPAKLATLMFDEWKLPVLKENKSKVEGKPNSRSTDKEVLHELAFIDVRAKKVKEYREALNAKGKFCTSVLKSLDYNDDGVTHPTAGIFRTYTGRQTVDSKQGRGKAAAQIGFALHQMKRGKEFREIVTTIDGYDIIEADASGQEFRWMAVASGDPTMLNLCQPGEDAHTYMGAAIVGMDYHEMLRLVHMEDKAAGQNRYLGKFSNLCIAHGTPVLTNHGVRAIQNVRADDLVWDGEEFVTHDGVRFSGVFPTISHDGVTGTPEHKVLVNGEWMPLEDAAKRNLPIDRASCRGAAVRILDGIVRGTLASGRLYLRACGMRLRDHSRSYLAIFGDRPVDTMQKLRDAATPRGAGALADRHSGRPAAAETSQRVGAALHQPERCGLAQLWWTGHQILLCLGFGSREIRQGLPPAHHLPGGGDRPRRQRRALRAREFATGLAVEKLAEYAAVCADRLRFFVGADRLSLHRADHAQNAALGVVSRRDHGPCGAGSAREAQGLASHRGPTVRTYDIVNCGPRSRFAANGRIVHNSLQYRTSARKLRVKARVDYDIPLELPEAQRIHATYQRTYPGVPQYWERQIALVKQLGYVETFGGNRINVVGDWNGGWGWSMGSTAINARIQGTGADQKHLAMMVLKDYLRQLGGRFLFDLHDGLYMLIPTRLCDKAVLDIKHMLDNLPYRQAWGFTPPVPMPWDVKRGKAWGRLKEVKFT